MEKRCSRCGETKLFSQFYSDSNQKNKTRRQSRCIECCKKDAAKYARSHKEWKAEQDKKYRQKYPEKERESWKRKYEARKEHYRKLANERQKLYRKRNPGVGLKGNAERLRRWRMRHPEKELERRMKREAKHLAPVWGDKEKIRVVYQKARKWGFEVDHIVPLTHPLVCGLHVWANLQLLDRNLNRVKKNVVWPDMPR